MKTFKDSEPENEFPFGYDFYSAGQNKKAHLNLHDLFYGLSA